MSDHATITTGAEVYLPLQDDAVSSVVSNAGTGGDFTLEGIEPTADVSGLGPTAWLPKAFVFTGDNSQGIVLPSTNYSDPFSFGGWLRFDDTVVGNTAWGLGNWALSVNSSTTYDLIAPATASWPLAVPSAADIDVSGLTKTGRANTTPVTPDAPEGD